MRTLISITALLSALLLAVPAYSAEWPDNPLGQRDNSYTALRIGVFYYAAVLQDLPDEQGVKPLPDGTDWLGQMAARPELAPAAMLAEQARVQAELEEGARFYWRNSRFNCAITYTWFNDYTPRLRSTIAASDAPYYGPQGPAEYAAAMQDFDGLCQIVVLYAYDKETGGLKRIHGGGGFTNGCDPANHNCGWSWWAATTADNVCGNDWLMVHEFGHQLDSLFDASGHPEFWFNHIGLIEGNIARYGEHFDANAYILRRAPEQDWLDLKWGQAAAYPDTDADSVPGLTDAITAAKLEADPDDASPDTDCDGMGDFAEFMASNGNRHGHGERLHPALKPCDPRDTDSDRDGVQDGADLLPMLPGSTLIPRHAADAAEPAWFASFTNTPEGLDFGLELSYTADTWDDALGKDLPGAMYITLYWGAARQALPERDIKLMLDLQNNGWFMGDDNYRVVIKGGKLTAFTQYDASSSVDWPADNDTAVDLASIPYVPVTPRAGFAQGLHLTLTKALVPQLVTKPGTMIRLNAGIRIVGEPWFYMLADPNSQLQLQLGGDRL